MTKQRTRNLNERPIIFSAPMVRAILDGRKTVTRRIVKWPAWANAEDAEQQAALVRDRALSFYRDGRAIKTLRCPYGVVDDRLWVRETWGMTYTDLVPTGRPFVVGGTWGSPSRPGRPPCVVFKVDGDIPDDSPFETARWSPSIHMPRWASRITLEVTGVRVERLQDISEADAEAEGAAFTCPQCGNDLDDEHGAEVHAACDDPDMGSHGEGFRRIWTAINGSGSWDANPFVWCLSFRRIET